MGKSNKGNFHPNAFQEGSSWYHRVKILKEDGSVLYSKRGGFQTAADAEKSYAKYEETFKKESRAYQMAHTVNADINFKDYLLYWFEEVYSARIENTTRMVASYTLYTLILPHMEQEIKLQFVNVEYLDALLETVSKSCPSAGNKSREFLNQALSDAVVQGYIRNNPVGGTKVYKRKKATVRVLSASKLKVLLKAASKGKWYLEVLLGVFCGLRKGEILGLKFCDFNMEEKTLVVRRQITSNYVIPKGQSEIEEYQVEEKEPKTENSYRMLRIPDVIVEETELRRKRIEKNKEKWGEEYVDHDYISCQVNGLPHSVTSFNTALSKLCARNGLPHITVHGLRHIYATILVEQGVPLMKISALLGHSSVNTTFEYYCSMMDENEKIISFMNETFRVERGA